MKIKYNRIITSTVFVLATSTSYEVSAKPIVFFGEDMGPLTGADDRPEADGAREAFLGNLDIYGTENFDSMNAGYYTTLSLNFSDEFYGTLRPKQNIIQVNESPVLAASGDNILSFNELLNNSFTINFDLNDNINSLGFYGIDVGDLGGIITLTLENGSSQVIDLVVPHTVPSKLQSYFYFGVIVPDLRIASATVGNNSGSSGIQVAGFDTFLFDDLTVGRSSYRVLVPDSGSTIVSLGFGFMLLNLGAVFARVGNRN